MYNKKAHIHFVGIGGIGMSGIAHILRAQGYHISGCDLDIDQKSVKDLVAMGCSVFHGNNTVQCADPSISILVYSSAVAPTSPEIRAAQARNIPTIPRALMLAELMRTKYSIAVAGAHGKTTTTSMISHILMEAQRDPTVVVGGHLITLASNARLGGGNFLVAETDESDKSLLKLYPTIALVTNIDAEHLDIYADIHDIKKTFREFLGNIPFYGKAIVCIDDEHARALLPITHVPTITYALDDSADIFGSNVILNSDSSEVTVHTRNRATQEVTVLGQLFVPMPGRHNILNALGATAVALDIEIPFDAIAQGLSTFRGVDRRFSFRGTVNGASIFDDYGHHPTEMYNTFLVARKKTSGKLIVAFQPHRYTRTHKLWNDFVELLSSPLIDELFITDIYPASEAPIEGITATRLCDEVTLRRPKNSTHYIPLDADLTDITQSVRDAAHEGDLVLLQGAGKIYKISQLLVKIAGAE